MLDNSRTPMTPVRNGAAHGATATLSGALAGFVGLYIARRYGIDGELAALGASAAVGTVMGVAGAIVGGTGAWARERKQAGDPRLIVSLLAHIG